MRIVVLLLVVATLLGASVATAQQSGFRILERTRDGYGNEMINFRCPDGSGGVRQPWSDRNGDRRVDCLDLAHAGSYSELLLTIRFIYETWDAPRDYGPLAPLRYWRDIPSVPGLRLYRYDVAAFCNWIVLRKGEEDREYLPGDVLLPLYDAPSRIEAAIVDVKKAVRAEAPTCARPVIDGWGLGGAIAAAATVDLRLDEGVRGRTHSISSTVYAAPFLSMLGGGYTPFVTAVARGMPYNPQPGLALSPRVWVLPRAKGVGVDAMISDLNAAFGASRPYTGHLAANARAGEEARERARRARRAGINAAAEYELAIAAHENWLRGQTHRERLAQVAKPETIALYGDAILALAKRAASAPDQRKLFVDALIMSDRARARSYGDLSGGFGAFMQGGELRREDVEAFLGSLPVGHVVVSLADAGESVAILAASRAGHVAAVIPIDRQSFETDLREIQAMVADPASDREETEARLLALSNRFLGPARGVLVAAKHVIWAPSGRLALLPPTVLSRLSESYDPLGPTVDIVVTPSIRSRMSKLHAAEGWHRGFLGVGDPEFPALVRVAGANGQGSMTRGRLRAAEGGFIATPLPETRREVAAISALMPAREPKTTLFGRQATPRGFLALDRSRLRYLHIATHGVLANEAPGVSEPALIFAADPDGNALLGLSDIESSPSSAQLTVLSACSTGVGDLVAGEGVIGLARSFLRTGSRNVVASYWPVDSLATEKLMVSFYRTETTARAPTQSLRAAMAEIRMSYPHPFYWGAFAVFE